MNKVSITQAAKHVNLSRSTLYKKYINTGIISVETVEDKKLIDMSELIRVFGNVQLEHNIIQDDTPKNTTVADKDKLIKNLEQQLIDAKDREE